VGEAEETRLSLMLISLLSSDFKMQKPGFLRPGAPLLTV